MFATLLTRPRLLTVGFAVTFAVLAGHPKLARSVGMDVWNVPELNQQLDAATNESNRLTCEGDVVLRRIAVKETIIKEMLAGRASLADATARFAEMNVNRPQAQEAVRHMYAGATDQEKTARNVIAFAAARVSAAEREALSRRLEAELQQMIAASSAH